MRAVGGADAPDPLAEFDTWKGKDADGRVKTEREYVEHLRSEWAKAHAERSVVPEQEVPAEVGPWQGPRFAPPFQGTRDEL